MAIVDETVSLDARDLREDPGGAAEAGAGGLAALRLPRAEPRGVAGPGAPGDDAALLRADPGGGHAGGAHPPHRAAALERVDRGEAAYLSWRELEAELSGCWSGVGTVAMEYAPGDAVPYVDRVPGRGAGDGARSAGWRCVSSADLVSAFYARWPEEGLREPPPRGGASLQETAHAAFAPHRRAAARGRDAHRVGDARVDPARAGAPRAEGGRGHHRGRERERRQPALRPDARAAAPPSAAATWCSSTSGARSRRSHLRRPDVDGLRGRRGARSASRSSGRPCATRARPPWSWCGAAGPRASRSPAARWTTPRRGVIQRARLGRRLHPPHRPLHRPRAARLRPQHRQPGDARHAPLIPGVGFSVEPGIYLAGDLGFRTEVDVFMGPDGPEVTTPDPQRELVRIEA